MSSTQDTLYEPHPLQTSIFTPVRVCNLIKRIASRKWKSYAGFIYLILRTQNKSLSLSLYIYIYIYIYIYWYSYENFLKVSDNRNKKRTDTAVTAIPKCFVLFVVYKCSSAVFFVVVMSQGCVQSDFAVLRWRSEVRNRYTNNVCK